MAMTLAKRLAASAHEIERATLALDTLSDVRSLMPLCRG